TVAPVVSRNNDLDSVRVVQASAPAQKSAGKSKGKQPVNSQIAARAPSAKIAVLHTPDSPEGQGIARRMLDDKARRGKIAPGVSKIAQTATETAAPSLTAAMIRVLPQKESAVREQMYEMSI
ncbi:MAG: hypothetical protein NC924_00185, partial [Candidatus Omnitrophica bacterium]|nr:hypothetical protein [Candidatus Omnitrophota bacterium]